MDADAVRLEGPDIVCVDFSDGTYYNFERSRKITDSPVKLPVPGRMTEGVEHLEKKRPCVCNREGKKMSVIAKIVLLLMGAMCFLIMGLEMFFWEKSGSKFFPEPEPGFFHKTGVMAANQGLYNGFLGAGMIWSVFIADHGQAVSTAGFFLACMVIAGIYGGFTATRKILLKQALPAAAALAIVLAAG